VVLSRFDGACTGRGWQRSGQKLAVEMAVAEVEQNTHQRRERDTYEERERNE